MKILGHIYRFVSNFVFLALVYFSLNFLEKYQHRAIVAILVLVYASMRAASALRSFYFFQKIERLEIEARRLAGLAEEGPAATAGRKKIVERGWSAAPRRRNEVLCRPAVSRHGRAAVRGQDRDGLIRHTLLFLTCTKRFSARRPACVACRVAGGRRETRSPGGRVRDGAFRRPSAATRRHRQRPVCAVRFASRPGRDRGLRGPWGARQGEAQPVLHLENALRRNGQGNRGALGQAATSAGARALAAAAESPCRLPRSDIPRNRVSANRHANRNPTAQGPEAELVAANTKFGILGQCEIATVSDGGCNCHCCGSVGVAGSSGVAGTTWTMR